MGGESRVDEEGAQAPEPAGFWVRAFAFAIDLCPLGIAFAMLPRGVPAYLFLLMIAAYKALMEGVFGATLGKMALGIRAQSVSGRKPHMGQAISRNVLWAVCAGAWFVGEGLLLPTLSEPPHFGVSPGLDNLRACLAVFLWCDAISITFNFRKRAWHDFMGATYCVCIGDGPEASGVPAAPREPFEPLVHAVSFYGERSARFLDLWGYLRASEDGDGNPLTAPIGESGPLAYDVRDGGRTVVLWFPGYAEGTPPCPKGVRLRQDSAVVEAVHAPYGEAWVPIEGAVWRLSKPFYYEFSEVALAGGMGLAEA